MVLIERLCYICCIRIIEYKEPLTYMGAQCINRSFACTCYDEAIIVVVCCVCMCVCAAVILSCTINQGVWLMVITKITPLCFVRQPCNLVVWP